MLSPDGKQIAFSRTVPGEATARTALFVADRDTRELRHLGTFGTRWTTPRWSSTGATILFSDDASGFQQVISVDAFSGQVRSVSSPTHDTLDAQFTPDGKAMVYLENRDGNLVPIVQDIGSGARRTVTVFPDGVHSDAHLTPDGDTLIVSYSGPQHPMDIWAVPLDGNAPRQLTHSLRGDDPARCTGAARTRALPVVRRSDDPCVVLPARARRETADHRTRAWWPDGADNEWVERAGAVLRLARLRSVRAQCAGEQRLRKNVP